MANGSQRSLQISPVTPSTRMCQAAASNFVPWCLCCLPSLPKSFLRYVSGPLFFQRSDTSYRNLSNVILMLSRTPNHRPNNPVDGAAISAGSRKIAVLTAKLCKHRLSVHIPLVVLTVDLQAQQGLCALQDAPFGRSTRLGFAELVVSWSIWACCHHV